MENTHHGSVFHVIFCCNKKNYHWHEIIHLFWFTPLPPQQKSRLELETLCFKQICPVLKRFLRLSSVWILAQQYFRSGDHKFEALGSVGGMKFWKPRRIPSIHGDMVVNLGGIKPWSYTTSLWIGILTCIKIRLEQLWPYHINHIYWQVGFMFKKNNVGSQRYCRSRILSYKIVGTHHRFLMDDRIFHCFNGFLMDDLFEKAHGLGPVNAVACTTSGFQGFLPQR